MSLHPGPLTEFGTRTLRLPGIPFWACPLRPHLHSASHRPGCTLPPRPSLAPPTPLQLRNRPGSTRRLARHNRCRNSSRRSARRVQQPQRLQPHYVHAPGLLQQSQCFLDFFIRHPHKYCDDERVDAIRLLVAWYGPDGG
ncbi:hypothetical protein NDU88_002581 [Pleurodeles waltl]|uniref:Uncharacterized protein n=1 Tax=Pleurodeles waltl TaxID=8319 RepID=A0AAV7PAE4_PLEWA|nr:hypothetical protein NDU88_002581 [Pleurodeles waltl]